MNAKIILTAVVLLAAGAVRADGPAETAGNLPKLNISFWIWGLYGMQEGGLFRDLDSRMVELKSRGFNCIRLDDAAGFYRTPDGRPRGKITFRKSDRTYTADMGGYSFMTGEPFDPAENLVRFVQACDRHGVKVILSSWYYLHTNWFVDDAFNRELFEDLPYERKYDYFADELSHAIGILRKNGLEHCIAYAEIFNEANALPFTHPGVPGQGTSEYMARDRELHEKAIAKLKKANPNVRFAYDFTGPGWIWKELVPRNADVIAFHDYYFWDIYGKAFEHGSVKDSAEEVPIAPEAMRFLRNPPVSFEEVKASRKGNLRTGNDWLSRVRLYASIDGRKVPGLEAAIEKRFAQDEADYKARFAKDVALVVKTRDELFPKADLVFAEGVSCCPNGRILFEQLSRRYWNMLLWQAELLRKSGVRGAIPRTNSGPEDPAWLMNSADLRAVNAAFSADGPAAAGPVKVIFDTDFYTDYDDVGAIAMLHALADAGECEILAMGTCTWGKGNRSVAAVEVLNAHYGRPDIPVGGTDHGGIEGAGAAGFGLAEKYRKWARHYETADAPKAVDVYRKALESAPDGSVVMVSVGFMNNLADLVRAHRELVARKVRIWVCMGCSYPSGKECNSRHDAKASDYAFRNWPTPIIWTDFQYGRTCYAGRAVAELSSAGDNPVRDVFRKMLTPREKVVVGKSWDQLAGHPSWDETAVLIAVKGWEPYFNIEYGRFEMVGTEGDDRWVPDPSSRSGRVVEKLPKEKVGKIIDELMCRSPKR